MAEQDSDQKNPNKDYSARTLVEKVRPIQKRVRQEGLASDGSDNKPMMDEAWGEGTDRD